jgi:hypothetical protein
MNEDERTGGSPADAGLDDLAAGEIDVADLEVLTEVAAMLADVDPVPVDLVGRVQFALALEEMYADVARITRVPLDALATRGDAATRAETLTFSAGRLSAMVTVSREGRRLRIDGWITPSEVMRVRIRMQDASDEVLSDETGRFVIRHLPEGFAQLSFHPVNPADPVTGGAETDVVVTPLFQL